MRGYLTEPAFLALLALVMVGAIQAAAAYLSRAKFAELKSIAQSVLSDPRANQVDRDWVRVEIKDALDRRFVWGAAWCAPLFFPLAIYAIMKEENETSSAAKELDPNENRRLIERAGRQVVKIHTGTDPREGKLWDDPRRKRMAALAMSAQFLSAPLSTLVIVLNLVTALPIVGILWLLAVSPRFAMKYLNPRIFEVVGAFPRFIQGLAYFR
ncbi:hypothetical protein [Phreatobacter stygius]|uniref:Uncharacterized protein n=1 Tax=Phreatobacter stygius TaxID=1940610 RepID=A0A4D7ARL5_9HYPH|nr:hypothetical protein [Phreatobacter stygius]QCI63599.1 hypothetical protein E8M01_04695 [Phreatobacter stygius]